MKITAILCNYNGATFLSECIDSVLSQSRPADEFLIVDDGSTDDSREVIKKLIQGRDNVHLIEHGSNQGQAAGFNTAIAAATGDWLCFIDSDDVWHADKLCKVEAAIPAAGEAVMIQHPLQVFIDGRVTGKCVPLSMTFGDLWHIWNHTFYFFPTFTPTTGLAIRADAARKTLPVPTHLRHSADSFLTRATIANGTVFAITEPLGLYRQHENNAVLGNESHNSWKFLLSHVGPSLDKYYLKNGLPSPIHRVLRGRNFVERLLDVSLRKILKRTQGLFRRKK